MEHALNQSPPAATPSSPFSTPPLSSITPPPLPQKEPPKSWLLIIASIILILVLGTALSLAFRIWDPVWSPFRPDPEKVVASMVKKMAELKTSRSELNLNLGAKINTEEIFSSTIKFISDLDATDFENPKSSSNFDITAGSEGMQLSLAGEVISIGDVSYFKLTKVPLPLFPFFDLSHMKDQWLKFDQKSKSYMETIFPEMPPEMIEEIERTKEEEQEIIRKIKDLLANRNLYIVKKELPDERIGNKNAYRYLVALNKEEVRKILPDLFRAIQSLPGGPPDEIALEEFLLAMDMFFAKIGEITAEVSIGKKDNYLYRIRAEKEIDVKQLVGESQFIEEAPEGIITIKADIEFSNFNKPVKVETPTEYKSFFEEIIGPSLFQQEDPFI